MISAKETLEHYRDGFKLLFCDVKTSSALMWKVTKGNVLTRRERRQLVRTTGDLLRLVPFSIFIIVPFMEFLLPVALKLFPNMLPSTFDDVNKMEERRKKQLKVKLEMAKVIQDSVEEIAAINPSKIKNSNFEIRDTFEKIKAKNNDLGQEEVINFLKVFEDELTLDNLTKNQIVALCKTLNLQTVGSFNFLTFQLRIRMRQLHADDKLIMKEGIDNMTVAELQTACQERGMRASGKTLDKLRLQLEQWLYLNHQKEIPMIMILLSRALMTSSITEKNVINTSLMNISDKLVFNAEMINKKEKGQELNNKEKLELLIEENKRIEEENAEESQDQKEMNTQLMAVKDFEDQTLIEKTENEYKPVKQSKCITQEELHYLSDAVTELASDFKLENERQELIELREDRQEYKENKIGIKDNFVKRQMERKIDRIIGDIEKELETNKNKSTVFIDADKDGIISVDEIIEVVKKNPHSQLTLEKLLTVLKKLDGDNDGKLSLKEIKDVFNALEREETDVTIDDISIVAELLATEYNVQTKDQLSSV